MKKKRKNAIDLSFMKTIRIFTKIFFFSGIWIPIKSYILFLLALNLSYFRSAELNGSKGCTRWSLWSDDKNPKINDNIYTNVNKSSYCDKNYTAKENMYPIQSLCKKNQRMIFCCMLFWIYHLNDDGNVHCHIGKRV